MSPGTDRYKKPLTTVIGCARILILYSIFFQRPSRYVPVDESQGHNKDKNYSICLNYVSFKVGSPKQKTFSTILF